MKSRPAIVCLPDRPGWIGRRWLAAGCLWLMLAGPAGAGMREVLDAVESSEFRFMRTSSDVPFMPLGWLQDTYYPNTGFSADDGALPDARAAENTFSLGAVMPVYVARRDMLVAGGDLAQDYIAVKSGPYRDQNVLRLTPVAAWLHQFGEDELVGAFVAPIFSKELRNDGPWGFSGYGGVIGIHWCSDKFQLLYGGVYENSFGQSMGYPYLGINWMPTRRCSLVLAFPWPTFTYTPADGWLLQLGISPGGSSWVQRGDGYEATESLGSWNLTAGVSRRIYKKLWVFGGAGLAGIRGVDIESNGNQARLEAGPSPVFTLAVQFRP
jgi:hypothetical protein